MRCHDELYQEHRSKCGTSPIVPAMETDYCMSMANPLALLTTREKLLQWPAHGAYGVRSVAVVAGQTPRAGLPTRHLYGAGSPNAVRDKGKAAGG